MKKRSIFYISGFCLLLGFAACKKEAERTADFETVPSTRSMLKVNYVSNYAANPSVQLKLNDVRVSPLLTARTPFPGGGFNTGGDNRPDYLNVAPGQNKFSVSIPNKNTANDSIVLYTTNINLEANKNFTLHITDTAANTKMLLVQDDISLPDTGSSRYRFVHLMPNVTALDLYHGTELVAGNIPYLGTTVFTRPTYAASTAWTIREAGTGPTGPVLATYSSSNTIITQRGYTAFALGYKGQADAARKPYISFLLNK